MGRYREYEEVICPMCGGGIILHRNYTPPSTMGHLKPILKGEKLSPYVCTNCWNEFWERG